MVHGNVGLCFRKQTLTEYHVIVSILSKPFAIMSSNNMIMTGFNNCFHL